MSNSSKPYLIVIDDDHVVENYFKELLHGTSVEFMYFDDPEEGFEAIKKHRNSVCIIDFIMPKLTGEELAIKFSEELLFENSHIYLYSAKDFDESEKFKILTLGFTELIKKPVEKSHLLKILESHGIIDSEKVAA